MNDKHVRQALKNLTINNIETSLSNGNQKGDENIQLTKFNNKLNNNMAFIHTSLGAYNQKSNTTINSSSSVLSMHTSTNQLNSLTTSHSFSSHNNLRNALGDIGNRISSASTNNQLNKKEIFNKPLQALIDNDSHKEINSQFLKATSTNDLTSNTEDNSSSNKLKYEEEIIDIDRELLDIDEFDSGNSQLVTEYAKDIYNYLRFMEKKYRISNNFLENKVVTSKMRAVLIDWLIQVHLKFHLLQETLYLTVQIIDSYLQEVDIPKMQLQLVGVTAMFVASKYEEMYVPSIDDFVYMTDNTYSKSEIRQMEISILKTLNFSFGKPTPLHFLRRFSKAGQADPKQHTLAKYFMELTLHDSDFSSMDPSYLAACALCLSFKLLNGPSWNRTLEHYSCQKEISLRRGMHKLSKLILKSRNSDFKYKAIVNKFNTSKLMRISMLPELNDPVIKEFASGVIIKIKHLL